jgi:DNA-directed RNA polymerase specialized sigma24 family protein
MADRDAWEQCLYRFARVLMRDADAARALVLEILENARKKPGSVTDIERFEMRQFQEIRRRALKTKPAVASSPVAPRDEELPPEAAALVRKADADAIEAALHGLPEPGRSALALLALDAMAGDGIARLLGLTPEDFADTLHGERLGLCAALSAQGGARA